MTTAPACGRSLPPRQRSWRRAGRGPGAWTRPGTPRRRWPPWPAAGQQVVAGVPARHLADVAPLAHAGDVLAQDHLHALMPSTSDGHRRTRHRATSASTVDGAAGSVDTERGPTIAAVATIAPVPAIARGPAIAARATAATLRGDPLGVRHQRHLAGVLDGGGDVALLLGVVAADPPGPDLGPIRQEALQQVDVLVVDVVDPLLDEDVIFFLIFLVESLACGSAWCCGCCCCSPSERFLVCGDTAGSPAAGRPAADEAHRRRRAPSPVRGRCARPGPWPSEGWGRSRRRLISTAALLALASRRTAARGGRSR